MGDAPRHTIEPGRCPRCGGELVLIVTEPATADPYQRPLSLIEWELCKPRESAVALDVREGRLRTLTWRITHVQPECYSWSRSPLTALEYFEAAFDD